MAARLDGKPKVFKLRQCKACHTVYAPTGPAAKFCSECYTFRVSFMVLRYSETQRIKDGRNAGVGSGGANAKTAENATEQSYRRVFLTSLYIKQRGMCKHCLEDFPESLLLIHHLDSNRKNNVETNLELVCKQCHQIEHECWLAFSKV